MENSRERKLRAIERWRSRKNLIDEDEDACERGSGVEAGSGKMEGTAAIPKGQGGNRDEKELDNPR
jgi:hypothetical protein